MYARDLGLDEWFDFVFDYSQNGKYLLENGRRIDISAELFQNELDFMMQDLTVALKDTKFSLAPSK